MDNIFEWDEQRNQSNFKKHGIWFEEAELIFESDYISFKDTKADYGEERIISIGLIKSEALVVVVHTDRLGKIRIISARKANKKERGIYAKGKKNIK